MGVLEIEKGGNELVKEITQKKFPELKDMNFQMVWSIEYPIFFE